MDSQPHVTLASYILCHYIACYTTSSHCLRACIVHVGGAQCMQLAKLMRMRGRWPSSAGLAVPDPRSVRKPEMADQLRLRGTLKGHGDWVTQIATTPSVSDMILSASRGTGLSV